MARARPSPYIIRLLRARLRLAVSVVVGLAVTWLLPADLRLSRRFLVGWDAGVVLYLVLAAEAMARAGVAVMRRRAAMHDEGKFAILILTVGAALASFGAIMVELAPAADQKGPEGWQLLLALLTILLSWAFTHTIFAFHYAHEYYSDDGRAGGLKFPGGEDPDYWDFMYFSFVIGMTSQVSDVSVSSKNIRRTAAAHGVVSFVFNAAVLALTVNIAATAI